MQIQVEQATHFPYSVRVLVPDIESPTGHRPNWYGFEYKGDALTELENAENYEFSAKMYVSHGTHLEECSA